MVNSHYALKQMAVSYMVRPNPAFEWAKRVYRDQLRQGLLNNLWDYNPGELDRWADDGGRNVR